MRYLDPKNDLTFKKIFGEHPKLLISFLNALLPLEEGKLIKSITYVPGELVPQVPLMKNTIVDVRCTDQCNRQFIVEMQMNWTTSFMQRVLFNAAKAYVKQLDKGDKYELLHPVYALNLIDDVFSKTPDYYHHYRIVETGDPAGRIEGLEFVFVELPKFEAVSVSEKKLQILWLRFLTEINEKTEKVPIEMLSDPDIKKAVECLQESAFSKEELEYYERYWDRVRTERTLINETASKAMQKGREEGRKEGREEGRKEGREEERLIQQEKQYQKKLNLAIIMKKDGESFEKIIKYTELSKEEIEKL